MFFQAGSDKGRADLFDYSSSSLAAPLPPQPSNMRLPVEDTSNDAQSSLSLSSDAEPTLSRVSPLTTGPAKTGPDHGGRKMQNGDRLSMTNGKSTFVRDQLQSNGVRHEEANGLDSRNSRLVKAVTLPGTRLYDNSCIDREAFIRLVVQSLREVGYT